MGDNGGMSQPQRYDTIPGPAAAELEISRSRFLCHLERVEDEAAARAVIQSARDAHPRARHHCSAFVLGPDARLRRSNDDGEPGGTAGAPMLDALVSAELSDVVAVVTRYFGGVLLGAGGLTRAYRAAVAAAVTDAGRVTREARRAVRVRCGYEAAPLLEAEARRRGWGIEGADYGAEVWLRLRVPEPEVAELAARAAELTAGAAELLEGELAFVDLPAAR